MRALILVAGAAMALSACGGGGNSEQNEVDTLSANNLVVEDSAGMNALSNGTADANAIAAMNGQDPATQNAMMNDLTSNDADTNLANGQ